MKLRRLASILIASVLSVSALAGCGDEENNTQTEKITTLKMVLIGDRPVIFDEIYSKVNEMLREDVKAELEIEYISMGDLAKKYPLLFASHEDFDMVFAARWQNYVQFAQKNGFMALTKDMIKANAPKTYETMPEIAWEQATVNGNIYMIPNNGKEYATPVVAIRGDLREKYGLDMLKSIEDFEAYLDAVAKNSTDMIPFVDMKYYKALWITSQRGYVNVDASIPDCFYDIDEPSGKVFSYIFSDEYLNDMKHVREMQTKGYWPADLASNKTTSTMFEMGKCATYVNNIETTSPKVYKLRQDHPEWKIEMYDFSNGVNKYVNNYTGNGIALNRTTKNAEKALQVIDLLRNDPRYYNLTNYGIEGKHWEKVDGDDKAYKDLNTSLAETEQYVPGCVWGWKNENLIRYSVDEIPEKQQILNRWKSDETVEHKLLGFNFNDNNVRNELASISNVNEQYGNPLMYGMIEDVEAGVNEYRKQLETAGSKKVIEEIQKQINEMGK